ncbi:Thiol-disulfide oxidoreductase ResA [anaerobic digester metagenome]|jgi:thiol-disulfide isomerase/thioredoxin|uniref:TlpA disulfide reductase family protein n=1 Tax=Oscillibacter ruminantium TaxID=1263547 RepID=UPI00031FD236|nr:TlpA disulfide reductase family protein [Oscillibacter ruminantium]
MTNQKTTIIIAAALVVVLLGASALYSSLSKSEASASAEAQRTVQPEDESVAAPDFTMLDAEGNSVALSNHIGTPIVLNFWASWCSPCKNEMPVFDTVAAELGDKVDFIMVNLTHGGRETVEGATQFIKEQGFTFPVYFDTLLEGATAYSVRSIPVTYFIDTEGNVQAYSAGSMDEDTLRQGIDMILAE